MDTIKINGVEYVVARAEQNYTVTIDEETKRSVFAVPYYDVEETGRVSCSDLAADGGESDKEMSLKIDYVNDIPAEIRRNKWSELYDAAERLQVEQVIRILMENKKDAVSAQASLQGSHSGSHERRKTLRERGYKFITRTQPINGRKDGEWYLFVKRIA